VRRRLGVLSAVFATYIREKDLSRPNPFASLQIPKEGHDKNHRAPFTATELATMDKACRAKDDPMRWILLLLAGTGARLAEVAGLLLDDIVLDAPIPHVILQVHPWRDIKGAKGLRGVKDRTVPLIGSALWAAERLKSEATHDQVFAFPQYTNSTLCKAYTRFERTEQLAAASDARPHMPRPAPHGQRPAACRTVPQGHQRRNHRSREKGHGRTAMGMDTDMVTRLLITSEWLQRADTESRLPVMQVGDSAVLGGAQVGDTIHAVPENHLKSTGCYRPGG